MVDFTVVMDYLTEMPNEHCRYSNPFMNHKQSPAPCSIVGLAVCERMPPIFVNRPKGWEHYLFIQFESPVQILLRGRMTHCGPGDLVIWPPNTPHYFGTAKGAWTHTWMYATGRKTAALVAASGLPFQTLIRLESLRMTERYFRALYEEVHGRRNPDDIILESHIVAWLREVNRNLEERSYSKPLPERLQRIIGSLQREPERSLSLGEMAHMASLSISQFSSVFRKHFGTSPINYLLNLRLQRALYYLSDESLNITQVATRVGFRDSLYFSKQFKRRYGMSPLKHRKATYNK
jgi:AraC family transcriptional regulator, arabinose operon regulatory protein